MIIKRQPAKIQFRESYNITETRKEPCADLVAHFGHTETRGFLALGGKQGCCFLQLTSSHRTDFYLK